MLQAEWLPIITQGSFNEIYVMEEASLHLLHANEAAIVPAGTFHNVINISKTTTLKLYTLYSPPNHPDGTIHKDKAEAEAAEAAGHH